MAFLNPTVNGPGTVYIVETTDGTTIVPEDVCGTIEGPWHQFGNHHFLQDKQDNLSDIYEQIKDYIEGRKAPIEIERRQGVYWGRMTATGYMDCTDWVWGKTEKDVLDQLNDMYEDDDDDNDYDDYDDSNDDEDWEEDDNEEETD